MVAHPDGMRPRWKRRAGEDFTEPVSFIDHLELRRGPLLLMRGLEGHCERSEAISMDFGDCFVAGAPRNDRDKDALLFKITVSTGVEIILPLE